MSKLGKRAREKIEEARKSSGEWLNLNGCELDNVPDEIFEFPQLVSLSLANNRIRSIPERILELSRLTHLDLVHNPLQDVPDVVGLGLDWEAYLRCRRRLSRENIRSVSIFTGKQQGEERPVQDGHLLHSELIGLPNLRFLYMGLEMIMHQRPLTLPKPSGELLEFINSLGEVVSLTSLSLFGVQLGQVPAGIRKLKNLAHLSLFGAGLVELPAWLSELDQLESLSVGMNELEELPNELSALPRLRALYAGCNRFAEVPEAVFRIQSLETLTLDCGSSAGYEGRFKQIPAYILRLPNLKVLSVEEQPIETPPPEVVKEGVEAIKNYWRQQQEVGVDYLCEAKLLIVGEAGAGKSSLAKKILDPEYNLRPTEPSTESIEITRWNFNTAIRVIQDGKERFLEREFRVNIWDFGGQEVYHATHQFFLTRRSLYALVTDDRKEDTDFNYWLDVVDLLSDRSPVLIVQNEKQGRRREINLGSLRARFPNLRDTYSVDLNINRGLSILLSAIRQEVERLPHIGVPLPRTWKRLRDVLEKDLRNYMGLDEYLAICQQHGFTRREDKLQLSGYLHDLGICLHFQDDPVLKQTLILKPKWGTDAVYRVLDNRVIVERRGRFGPEDLARIWAETEYVTMRHELLRLMMKFNLCYELPEGGAFIAPQLLSPTQPVYNWETRDNLILRYEYDFMPKGLITRFIVALNHLIVDQTLVWKGGVILEREGARAEVIEDYSRRKISVRVAGPDARGLLTIVDDQLERIHRLFPRLKYEKFLPCNCGICSKRSEPFAYSLTELRDFAYTGDPIQCRISRKLVDATGLVRDLFPAALYLAEQPRLFATEECPPAQSQIRKKVFVSYAWTDESKAIVDQIEAALSVSGITLVRDRSELKYKDSIRNFMERIGRGKCIIVILSKRYLESKNCMFELTEIAGRGDVRDRVFPVVLKDANIYDGAGRLDHIAHWERQINVLDSKMKTVSSQFLNGIREELDLFVNIRNAIAGIVDTLGDMNALTPDQHRGSDFRELLQKLEIRLAE